MMTLAKKLTILFLLLPTVTLAQTDLDVSAGVRSYALGGSLDLSAGYGAVFWGDRTPGQKNPSPWFGYIRPAATLSTTGSYNRGELQLQVYPVSFIGVSAGGFIEANSSDYQDYDCNSYVCQGRWQARFVEGDITLGVGSLFFNGGVRYEKYEFSNRYATDIIIVEYGLPAATYLQDIRTFRGLLGWRWSEQWLSAIYYKSAHQTTELESKMEFATFNQVYQSGSCSYMLGVGTFESSLKERGLTGVIQFRWQALPSVGLL